MAANAGKVREKTGVVAGVAESECALDRGWLTEDARACDSDAEAHER
jgi:hypothetical protein